MKSWMFILAMAGSLAAATGSALAQDGTTVRIDTGALKGAIANEVVSFKGIPYAAPPTGELRWRDPQSVAKWTGVREATSFGKDCMQAKQQPSKISEDCLFLNVWRPAKVTGELPVMVWIHGGGLVEGGSSSERVDGSEFARRGVVLVSFNYRLGRFGFFGFPALTAAAPPDEVLGDYGMMDQVAALRWVQRNITAFGGDPGRVTIFGESAGGFSVVALMASPMTKGLLHQAAAESGGGRPTRFKLMDPRGLPYAEQCGVAFAKSVGIEGTGPKRWPSCAHWPPRRSKAIRAWAWGRPTRIPVLSWMESSRRGFRTTSLRGVAEPTCRS